MNFTKMGTTSYVRSTRLVFVLIRPSTKVYWFIWEREEDQEMTWRGNAPICMLRLSLTINLLSTHYTTSSFPPKHAYRTHLPICNFLSPFALLLQNIIDWEACKQQECISYSFGDWKSKMRERASRLGIWRGSDPGS